MEIARITAPSSSFRKNYVTLRQLQELRLKEKQDAEERIRNPKQHPQTGTEARRNEEERLRNLDLEKTEGKESGTPSRKPSGSRKLPSNGLRWVVVGRAHPAPKSIVAGAKGGGGGADRKTPIGKAAGSSPNAEVKQKKKKQKKKKRQAGDSNKKVDAVSAEAAAEEVNGSEIIAADPPPEESVQLKQVAGRNRQRKTAPKKSSVRHGEPWQEEEPKRSKSVAADPLPEKPIQPNEVKPVEGDGPKGTMKIERPGINETDAAGKRGNRSARRQGEQNGMAEGVGVGGRGERSANRAGPVQAWVRKTASS